jgi:Zn-dependent protease
VPVRLSGIRQYRRAHILISLAGPGANLLLGAVCLALYLALGCALSLWAPNAKVAYLSAPGLIVEITGIAGAQILTAIALVLKLGFLLNVILAGFNLIPIPPLDGSWVLEHLFPSTLGRFYAAIRRYGFLIFLALIYTGAIGFFFFPVRYLLRYAFLMIRGVTGL